MQRNLHLRIKDYLTNDLMHLKSGSGIITLYLLLLSFSAGAQSGKVAEDSAAALTLTLKKSIAYGLEHHPSVQIARNNTEKARQAGREALAGYLPQVNVTAGIDDNIKLQQTIIPAGTFGPGTPEQRVAFGTQWNTTAMAQADQKIYDQSLITGLKANKPNNEIAAWNEVKNNQQIIYDISSAYFRILVARRQLDLLNSNKARFEKILNVTQLQEAQGVAKKVDIKQVQVNLNNVLAQISVTEKNLALAENLLKNSMGLPQDQSIVLQDTARWLHEPALKETPVFQYENNVDYHLQKLQIRLYDINRKMIRQQAIPTLSVYGRYGANGFGQEFKNAFDPMLDYSSVGIRFSWSLFTGFRRDAQYRQATLDYQNAMLNLNLNQALQELQYQNADIAVNQAQITIRTNKQNMELAEEVYENTTLQYQHGLLSLSDLLNAELSYREAQSNYITSLLDYYLADLDLENANGGLSIFYENL